MTPSPLSSELSIHQDVSPPGDIIAPQGDNRSCRLYQIPEEIILELCKFLDGSDVYIMRQTCQKFRRILSTPRFVQPTLWTIGARVHNPRTYFDLPTLKTDWGDVVERLRRRGCCSSCTNARLPGPLGADSTYDRVMRRMENQRQWCDPCMYIHPLILFPHDQRGLASGARCILSLGGIKVCPHFSFSVAEFEKIRRQYTTPERKHRRQLFRCGQCSGGMTGLMLPTVTWVPGFSMWPTRDRIKIKWRLYLKLDKKDFFYIKQYVKDGLNQTDAHRAVQRALSRASKNHDDLLCPHRSFDDGRLLEAFKREYPSNPPLIFPTNEGGATISRQYPDHYERYPDVLLASFQSDDTCRSCNLYESSWGNQVEWKWEVRNEEATGLSLEREITLTIPDLRVPYKYMEHDEWLQMLPPPSYGLLQDVELRHITWCPDKACANGREDLRNHFRVLGNVQSMELYPLFVPEPGVQPAVRGRDLHVRRVEDPLRYV
ncbi:hypothetical protein PG993_010979 [Apiospora rasikravindrae]|uniref:F-box domain-containing protein n=1 Tax=Apiospora rasikravindrae TaxID=990691 RepID=A0ABR1SD26_9PEZI